MKIDSLFYFHHALDGLVLLLLVQHGKVIYWYFFVFQHLVAVVADGIYIHSLRDMKLLHKIPNSLHDAPRVCVLSSGMPVLGQDTPSYLAFSNSGDMRIFDIVDLVSTVCILASTGFFLQPPALPFLHCCELFFGHLWDPCCR